MENPYSEYKHKFSVARFWKKLVRVSKRLGVKAVYSCLLLFYAYKRKETPSWAKNIVLGTLGYFLSPIDLVPDLTPIIGYTDDIGVLSFGVITIAAYIDEEVRKKARKSVSKWFKNYDASELEEIDQQLK